MGFLILLVELLAIIFVYLTHAVPRPHTHAFIAIFKESNGSCRDGEMLIELMIIIYFA